jgi:predicted short-subunit dehydrogenase-like oxidoreductase (DUF2520 family)
MAEYLKISIIGSGNLAWHLARKLEDNGHIVNDVYSLNPKNAEKLTSRLYDAKVKLDLDYSDSPSELFILCISDSAIESVVSEIILPDDAILVHTSGAMPISKLAYSATDNIGVFYPLQTFSKDRKVNWKGIPILIEGENKTTELRLLRLAENISGNTVKSNSEQRRIIHLAAVFASNFTNYMLCISDEILESGNLDFELLKPLIVETINKSLELGPHNAQTGPARRGDLPSLENHLKLLNGRPSEEAIYSLVSQAILDRYYN